jgi:hypothetical protein
MLDFVTEHWRMEEESGDSLDDEVRPGRPRPTKYRDAIRTLLNQNPCLLQKRIARILSFKGLQ